MAVTEIWPINVRLDKFIAYHHGEATNATADIGFEITDDKSIAKLKPYEADFYLLSEEDVESNIKKNNGRMKFDEETEFGKENN